jgi:hypothetical protein
MTESVNGAVLYFLSLRPVRIRPFRRVQYWGEVKVR